ncbi:unnamed protein product [Dicrocoelium dendriticum]|nr:unnamed protein product [Dicrocoelium dendriticum]
MFCNALLTAPNSQGIYMYFLELDLEDSNSVLYDYMLEIESGFLRVLDGSDCGADVIYLYRGNSTFQPRTIYSTSNALVIVLAVPKEYVDHMYSSYSFRDANSNFFHNTTVPERTLIDFTSADTTKQPINRSTAPSATEHPVDSQRRTLLPERTLIDFTSADTTKQPINRSTVEFKKTSEHGYTGKGGRLMPASLSMLLLSGLLLSH